MGYRKYMAVFAICTVSVLSSLTTSAQIFSVRANALSAFAATVDVGAEVSVADKWTVGVAGCYNPVRTVRFSTSFYAVRMECRYWLYESFIGHFFGTHIVYANYDIGRVRRRYDGYAVGSGFSYGYSWMLSERWNVTLHAGIGVFRSKDIRRDFTVGDWDDEYVYRYRRWMLLPSDIGVSFSYLF
jgi:hypothetical protein